MARASLEPSRTGPSRTTMAEVLRGEKKEVAARTFGAQVDKDLRRSSKRDEANFQTGIVISVVSLLLFFFLNIYIQRFRYPDLYAWWYRFVKKAKVQGVPAKVTDLSDVHYSMNQVCVARDFPPVQTVLSIGVWKNLSRSAAEFLILSVNYFQSNPYVASGGPATRDKLTSLHWNGSYEQWTKTSGHATTDADLMGPDGFLCPKGGMTGDEDAVKTNIVAGWKWSKYGPNRDKKTVWNIWYDFFPDPDVVGEEAFLSCPVINGLFSGSLKDEGAYTDPCSPYGPIESNLMQLMAGGLCFVALQNSAVTTSGNDLFQKFFSPRALSFPQTACSGDLLGGAVSGATSSGMLGMGLMTLLPVSMTLGAIALGALGGGAAGFFGSKGQCQKYITPDSASPIPETGKFDDGRGPKSPTKGAMTATGPEATGPAATGPAATGPAATGPAATGPAAAPGPGTWPASTGLPFHVDSGRCDGSSGGCTHSGSTARGAPLSL